MQKIRIQGTGPNSTKLKENNEMWEVKLQGRSYYNEGIKEEQRCELK